ncbi:MAG: hypothetical protein R8N50_02400 [Alphaproteobacteria bacterium]|nr:hypothetical protein [Alphaproteobacteria bacterium]
MKVKNIVFSGFAAAVLMGVAADANADTHVVTKGYIDSLNSTVSANAGEYVTGVTQTAGKLTGVAKTGFETEITATNHSETNAPTAKAVYDYVEANDDNTTYTGSGYVSIDGNNDITVTNVTNEAAGINDSSELLTTGKAVYDYVEANDSDTTYTGSGYVSIDTDNNITVTNVTNGSITDGSTELTTANAVYDYVTQLTGGVLPQGCENGDCALVKIGGTLQWVELTTPVLDQTTGG